MGAQVSICVFESFDLGLMELDGLVDWLNALELDAVVLVCLHACSLHAIS